MQQVILNGIEFRNFLSEIRQVISEEVNKAPIPPPEKRFLDVDEAAEFLSIAKSTLYRLTSEEQIPFTKKTGKLLFDRSELLVWLKSGQN